MPFAARRQRLATAFTTLLLAAACGGSTPSAAVSSSPASPSGQAARTLTLTFAPQAGRVAHGTLQIDLRVGSGYVMTATVLGLDPGSAHDLNFHPGNCSNIDWTRSDHIDVRVVADASGHLVDVTQWPGTWFVPSSGRVVTIEGDYAPPGRPEDRYISIACADLTQ